MIRSTKAKKLETFVDLVARLSLNGEVDIEGGHIFDMSSEDALASLESLIRMARDITQRD